MLYIIICFNYNTYIRYSLIPILKKTMLIMMTVNLKTKHNERIMTNQNAINAFPLMIFGY